jgi:hypothetical protein
LIADLTIGNQVISNAFTRQTTGNFSINFENIVLNPNRTYNGTITIRDNFNSNIATYSIHLRGGFILMDYDGGRGSDNGGIGIGRMREDSSFILQARGNIDIDGSLNASGRIDVGTIIRSANIRQAQESSNLQFIRGSGQWIWSIRNPTYKNLYTLEALQVTGSNANTAANGVLGQRLESGRMALSSLANEAEFRYVTNANYDSNTNSTTRMFSFNPNGRIWSGTNTGWVRAENRNQTTTAPRARRVNDIVYLDTNDYVYNGQVAAGWVTLGNLRPEFRPSSQIQTTGTWGGSTVVRVNIDPNGDISRYSSIANPAGQAGLRFSVAYPVN